MGYVTTWSQGSDNKIPPMYEICVGSMERFREKNIKSVSQETVKNVKEEEEVKVEILRILDSFWKIINWILIKIKSNFKLNIIIKIK